MGNKRFIIGLLLLIVILGTFVSYKYSQYFLAWQGNQKINVSGIKLMMSEKEVKDLLGKEDEYIQGFGGYKLNYQSKGIYLEFLDDRDTDFYHKVSAIFIIDPKYEIFKIKVGDESEESLRILQKQGFNKQKPGYPGYWKMNMYMILDNENDKVQKITIGIRDRVSSDRVY